MFIGNSTSIAHAKKNYTIMEDKDADEEVIYLKFLIYLLNV